MGVDQTVFFGPYVKCTYKTRPSYFTAYFCENNKKHKVNKTHNFCPKCGSSVQNSQVKSDKEYPDLPEGVLEKFDNGRLVQVWTMCDDLGEPNTHYYFSNTSKDGLNRTSSFHKYETGIVELSPDNILDELHAFSEVFAEELKLLKDTYVDAKVCWGVISTCY